MHHKMNFRKQKLTITQKNNCILSRAWDCICECCLFILEYTLRYFFFIITPKRSVCLLARNNFFDKILQQPQMSHIAQKRAGQIVKYAKIYTCLLILS